MLRPATAADVPAMLAIYAPYVTDTAVTFEYDPPTEAEFAARFARITANYPWLVLEEEGRILGYAYADRAFEKAAYAWCADMTIYLAPEAAGQGRGKALYLALEEALRRQGIVILYALASLSGSITDLLVFYIARRLLEAGPVADGNMTAARAVLIATVVARAVSSFLNFNLNNRMVFNGRGDYGKMLLRYYALAVPVMLVSAGLVALLSGLAGTGASILTTCIKFVVDICLFFLCFRIQQTWVFREEKEK